MLRGLQSAARVNSFPAFFFYLLWRTMEHWMNRRGYTAALEIATYLAEHPAVQWNAREAARQTLASLATHLPSATLESARRAYTRRGPRQLIEELLAKWEEMRQDSVGVM
jgi:hypothetical protein